MSNSSHCWQCGDKLKRHGETLVFKLYTPPGADEPVRVHAACEENLKKPEPDFTQPGVRRAVRRYLNDGDE